MNKITNSFIKRAYNAPIIKITGTTYCKNLEKEIELGNFRQDLFHRLAVIPIHVPSLNERKEDIPLLSHYFLELVCEEMGIAKKIFLTVDKNLEINLVMKID